MWQKNVKFQNPWGFAPISNAHGHDAEPLSQRRRGI